MRQNVFPVIASLALFACLTWLPAQAQEAPPPEPTPAPAPSTPDATTPPPEPPEPSMSAPFKPGESTPKERLLTPEERAEMIDRMKKERREREQDEEAESQPRTCQELVAAGSAEAEFEALTVCREALEEEPESLELIRLLAELEFEVGDSASSVELWQKLIDLEGWSADRAHGLAMAQWRARDLDAAEATFEGTVERSGTAEAYADLIHFLLSFSRYREAGEVAGRAAERFPGDCTVFESWAVAEAALEHDARAAELVAEAIATGCPPFEWTTRGVLSQRWKRPEYRKLLDPEALVDGLDELGEFQVLARLRLLEPVMCESVLPAVTQQVIEQTKMEIRLAGLGLLIDMGTQAMGSWETILDLSLIHI